MSDVAEIGKIYQHYKGHLYKVIGKATHSETLEPMVLYQRIDPPDNQLWARPEHMWFDIIGQTQTRRFEPYVY